MIARVVPVAEDPLFILAEDYNEWTADAAACVGEPPSLAGLEWVPNQTARLQRKLYLHNTGHATCAYLGFLRGHEFVHEAAQDPWVLDRVRAAITDSGRAVAAEYGFAEEKVRSYAENLLERLPADALPDRLARVIREPIRKLGPDERFLGPLRLCARHGLPRQGLCVGIAAVLVYSMAEERHGVRDDFGFRISDFGFRRRFRVPQSAIRNPQLEDAERLRLAALVRERGPVGAVQEVSGGVLDDQSAQAVAEAYARLGGNVRREA
jgi:mannitol-1-phosphate/altronate dehydrogenase